MNDPKQPSESSHEQTPEPPRSPLKTIGVAIAGVISVVYLLNPTAGLLELIPDNIPVLGNLDEAAAIVIILSCLSYFGVELKGIFGEAVRNAAGVKGQKPDESGPVVDVETEKAD